jgi:hypothetical protein
MANPGDRRAFHDLSSWLRSEGRHWRDAPKRLVARAMRGLREVIRDPKVPMADPVMGISDHIVVISDHTIESRFLDHVISDHMMRDPSRQYVT